MSTPDSPLRDDTISVGHYLSVLRRRKWSVILVTLLAIAAAAAYLKVATPIYASNATVQSTVPVQQGGAAGSSPNMSTESSLVTSSLVARCASLLMADPTFRAGPTASTADPDTICSSTALDATPLSPPIRTLIQSVSTTIVQGDPVMVITFSDPSVRKAQAGAQAFALSYIKIKLDQANQTLDTLKTPLIAQQTTLKKQLTIVNKAIAADLAASSKEAQDNANRIAAGLPPNPPDLALVQKFTNDTAQQANIQGQLNTVNSSLLELDPSKIDPPTVLVPAGLPPKPASPKPIVVGALGVLAGLALGIAVAFVRERLDDGLRGRSDLETAIGAPVLGVVPKVPGWKNRHDAKLVSREQPKSGVAESYRTLRTSVSFAAAQSGIKTIMITSPAAGDGKTTTAANLALVLADAGKRVVLVSADLRKPRIHQFFELSNEVGLSNVLAGEVEAWEAILDPGVENLRIMPSGPVPSRPAEMLQSEHMTDIINGLRDVSDFIIIDTAPVLLVSDALALVPLTDGVLFVADAEKTPRSAVMQTRDHLQQVGATIFGAVLNDFDPRKAKAYRYTDPYASYRYRYGSYGYDSPAYEKAHENGSGPRGAKTRGAVEDPNAEPSTRSSSSP
jgi:capsular exopolysaccharide synthesis family protein